MLNPQKLDSQLILDEDLRLRAYYDTAKPPRLTTGVGRNLDANPLSPAEMKIIGHDARVLPITHDGAIFLLHNDEMKAMNSLDAHCSWWVSLEDVRARVMVGLMFNMGWGKLQLFKHFLADMSCGTFSDAADALKDSLWYTQVGHRGPRYVGMVRTGQDAA